MAKGAPASSWPRIAAAAAVVLIAVNAFNARSIDAVEAPASVPAKPEAPRAIVPPMQFAALRPPPAVGSGRGTLINVGGPMRYGQYVWSGAGVPSGPVWIRVDLGKQLISVFRGRHEIGTAVILYGADEKPTPRGQFGIIAKLKDHRSSLYDAPMPYTLRLTHDGIAIHGSDVAEGAATHGCIGVPKEFAALLFDAAAIGEPVTIV